MMESSHLERRPCAVLLQEAVAEKVRRWPGSEARAKDARGAGPTCVSWCSRRTQAPLRPRNKGCARQRRRDPGCRPRLSHSRSETRLRRALRSPTRGAPPRCRSPPRLPTPPSSRHPRALCNTRGKPRMQTLQTQSSTTQGQLGSLGFPYVTD